MKAGENNLQNNLHQRILEFLKDHHHSTVKAIAENVLGDTSPKAVLAISRRLTVLHENKYVSRQRLSAHLGAMSPFVYSLLTRGAREVGLEKVPSQFYRPQKSIWHEFEEAKLKLEQIAERHNWTIFEGDEVCRAVLIYYSFYIDSLKHGTGQEKEIERARSQKAAYNFSLPSKISPDFFLATEYDLIAVLIAHPRSYGKFLKKRLERYKNVFGMVKIAVITLTDEQMKNCQRIFDGKSNISYDQYRDKVLIIDASEIDHLPTYIARSTIRYVQYESSRRILINWKSKEGNIPSQRFRLPTS